MKISVITVCYNSAKTLERALQSVVDQDWPHIEHIVIDGGSTDETSLILKRFNHLAALVSEPDKGIYDAMNKGLKLATGEIICFLNADDQYASTSILSYVAKMMMDSKVDALMGDVVFFRKDNPNRSVRRYRSDRFTPERLAWGWMPAHPGLFITSKEVKRVGYFKVDYKIAGDFEFIIRIFNKQNIRYQYVPEVLVRMQVGGVSTSGLRSKILLNFEVLRACRENGLKTNLFKILSRYPAKTLEFLWR
jgi:glycosyltransferase involved in cell wall biosynthesis